MNILHPDWFGSLEQMLDDLPPNRPLVQDSGRWYIGSENLDIMFYQQRNDEDFFAFIKRAYEAENIYHDMKP